MKRCWPRCAAVWNRATRRSYRQSSRRENKSAMLWQVDIYPAPGQPDMAAARVVSDAAGLGLAAELSVRAGHGYLVQGELDRNQIERLASELFSDPVVEL